MFCISMYSYSLSLKLFRSAQWPIPAREFIGKAHILILGYAVFEPVIQLLLPQIAISLYVPDRTMLGALASAGCGDLRPGASG